MSRAASTVCATALFALAATGAADASRPTAVAAGRADLGVTVDDGGPRAMVGRGVVYRIRVTNAGPDAVTGARVEVPAPAELTEVEWSCRASAGASCGPPYLRSKDGWNRVHGRGSIDRRPDLSPGSEVVFTLRGILAASGSASLGLVATVGVPPGVVDPDRRNDRARDVDRVISPFTFWKRVEGDQVPGGRITYTLWVVNRTPVAQPDNPGAEIVDVLPPELELLYATASFGEVEAKPESNRVTWSGELPPNEILGLVIGARIADDVVRREVVNRGELRHAIALDATRDVIGASATNDTLALSEDFDTGGPTIFRVLGNVLPIPALDVFGLLLLALGLGLAAVWALRAG